MQILKSHRPLVLAFCVAVLLIALPAFQTHTFPALDTNNTFTGVNTFNNKVEINNLNDIIAGQLFVTHGGGNFGLVIKRNANDSGGTNLTFLKSRGDAAVVAQNGDQVGNVFFQAVATDLSVGTVAAVRSTVSTVGATQAGSAGFITFETKNTGDSGSLQRWTIDEPGNLKSAGRTFANLGTPANGSIVFCTDCNSTCTAGASTGRTCFRENGAWTH